MTEQGVQRALTDAVSVLDRIGARYALVGGLAVSAWAVPRATRDADLWVDLEARRSELEVALSESGFEVPAMGEELEQFGVFRSKHLATGVFVDMFNAVGPLGEAILARRKAGQLDALTVWLASPEDVAVLKAFSDRPRDVDDLVALLRITSLDVAYVKGWAQTLDLSIESDEVSRRLETALELARAQAT